MARLPTRGASTTCRIPPNPTISRRATFATRSTRWPGTRTSRLRRRRPRVSGSSGRGSRGGGGARAAAAVDDRAAGGRTDGSVAGPWARHRRESLGDVVRALHRRASVPRAGRRGAFRASRLRWDLVGALHERRGRGGGARGGRRGPRGARPRVSELSRASGARGAVCSPASPNPNHSADPRLRRERRADLELRARARRGRRPSGLRKRACAGARRRARMSAPADPRSSPPPRRAGWWRIAAFFVMGGACVALGHYEIAPLFAGVGVLVWWIDRGLGKPPSEGPGPTGG